MTRLIYAAFATKHKYGWLIIRSVHSTEHFSKLSDSKLGDFSKALSLFREGDKVRAHVLSVDLEKKRIAFGLKPSYFNLEDAQFNPKVDGGAVADDLCVESGEDGGQSSDGVDSGGGSSGLVQTQISPDPVGRQLIYDVI